MELGERIRQARLEAGLSQRQVCAGEITRNMLSQIENGTAKPSMATLQYLASRLGKGVSYFLDEDTVTSPNQRCMDDARAAYAAGDAGAALDTLESYRAPDGVFDQEMALLRCLCLMDMAEGAISDGKFPYAAQLLARAGENRGSLYYTAGTERRRLLLLAKTGQETALTLASSLPDDDDALLLRAEAALQGGQPERCEAILDAAEDQKCPRWNLLRGEAAYARKEYARAAECFAVAESAYPRQVWPRLEECCKELGDYKRAYEYALKQR